MPYLWLACQLHCIKAHQTRAVHDGWITMVDFQGNQEADMVASFGAAEHEVHEPSAVYLFWEQVAQAVRHVWLLVGHKLRERPEAWSHVRLLAPAVEEALPQVLPAEPLPQAPHKVGPHKRVVAYEVEPQQPEAEPLGRNLGIG
eukprot:2441555-Amphidinium_carterae.1